MIFNTPSILNFQHQITTGFFPNKGCLNFCFGQPHLKFLDFQVYLNAKRPVHGHCLKTRKQRHLYCEDDVTSSSKQKRNGLFALFYPISQSAEHLKNGHIHQALFKHVVTLIIKGTFNIKSRGTVGINLRHNV